MALHHPKPRKQLPPIWQLGTLVEKPLPPNRKHKVPSSNIVENSYDGNSPSLENLPFSIKLKIIEHLPTVSALKNLITASSQLLFAYRTYADRILVDSLANLCGAYLPQAIVLYNTQQLCNDAKESDLRAVYMRFLHGEDILQHYFDVKKPGADRSLYDDQLIDYMEVLENQHTIVETWARNFLKDRSKCNPLQTNTPEHEFLAPTALEEHRAIMAIYRILTFAEFCDKFYAVLSPEQIFELIDTIALGFWGYCEMRTVYKYIHSRVLFLAMYALPFNSYEDYGCREARYHAFANYLLFTLESSTLASLLLDTDNGIADHDHLHRMATTFGSSLTVPCLLDFFRIHDVELQKHSKDIYVEPRRVFTVKKMVWIQNDLGFLYGEGVILDVAIWEDRRLKQWGFCNHRRKIKFEK